ncbi:MAG: DUF4846 domain-containing protein [Vicingaceae bacterium]|nr:DUF4846 domain-containing protein [Vicingaceae bacterium]
MFVKLKYLIFLTLISAFASCQNTTKPDDFSNDEVITKSKNLSIPPLDKSKFSYSWLSNYDYNNSLINNIKPPKGFERVKESDNSFGAWLNHLPLKENKTVFLYNGEKKYNQSAQYKVIDIDVGDKDLQQCADAVMRLRAEYLLSSNQLKKIHFNYTNGITIPYSKWSSGLYPILKANKVVWVGSSNNSSYKSFRKYMDNIFMYAGTASLEKELLSVNLEDLKIGDVFIKGGFPGHAVLVVDVAENNITKEKCFILVQSYMPAQNIHVLNNPNEFNESPWYYLKDCNSIIETPEWTFYPNQLKRFK